MIDHVADDFVELIDFGVLGGCVERVAA